jgi:hypothetical protein
MPQATRYLYYPRQCDEFVGEILYHRQGRTETDFDLYRDTDTEDYFVVGSESHQCGPVLQNSHTRFTVGEFLALHPDHRQRTADMLRERVTRR